MHPQLLLYNQGQVRPRLKIHGLLQAVDIRNTWTTM